MSAETPIRPAPVMASGTDTDCAELRKLYALAQSLAQPTTLGWRPAWHCNASLAVAALAAAEASGLEFADLFRVSRHIWRLALRNAGVDPEHGPQADTGAELRSHLDDDIRRRHRGTLPWERPVKTGEIDWWRVHSHALDRIDALLAGILPDRDAEYDKSYWRGRHDAAAPWFIVSLMTGAWSEPGAHRGSDLISLFARIYRMPPHRAAFALAEWCGIEAVRQ